MILEIDAGNTRIKWRLSSQRSVVARGVVNTESELLVNLPGTPLTRVRLSSVRSGERTETLRKTLTERLGITIEVAEVQATQAGVINAYADFRTMGVDRWLAILASFNRRPGGGCCVLSCGTALTVDAVSAAGLHLGGYIIPGLTLQRTALLQNTAIRLPHEIDWSEVSGSVSSGWLGRSTKDAVDTGILDVLATGLANFSVVRSAAESGRLYLTGGDAVPVALALQGAGVNSAIDHDIILDGLAYALP